MLTADLRGRQFFLFQRVFRGGLEPKYSAVHWCALQAKTPVTLSKPGFFLYLG